MAIAASMNCLGQNRSNSKVEQPIVGINISDFIKLTVNKDSTVTIESNKLHSLRIDDSIIEINDYLFDFDFSDFLKGNNVEIIVD